MRLVTEGDAGCLFRLNGKRLLLFEDGIVGLRIDEYQFGLSADSMVRSVEDACRQLGLVAHTDKTRHIGLNHHILLRYGFTSDVTI